jgi:hypothetical protein
MTPNFWRIESRILYDTHFFGNWLAHTLWHPILGKLSVTFFMTPNSWEIECHILYDTQFLGNWVSHPCWYTILGKRSATSIMTPNFWRIESCILYDTQFSGNLCHNITNKHQTSSKLIKLKNHIKSTIVLTYSISPILPKFNRTHQTSSNLVHYHPTSSILPSLNSLNQHHSPSLNISQPLQTFAILS